jgi:hypothetical protein
MYMPADLMTTATLHAHQHRRAQSSHATAQDAELAAAIRDTIVFRDHEADHRLSCAFEAIDPGTLSALVRGLVTTVTDLQRDMSTLSARVSEIEEPYQP